MVKINEKHKENEWEDEQNCWSKIKADYNKWLKKIPVPPWITLAKCVDATCYECETMRLGPTIELNYILMNQFGIETKRLLLTCLWSLVFSLQSIFSFGWARNEPIRSNTSKLFYSVSCLFAFPCTLSHSIFHPVKNQSIVFTVYKM